MLTSDDLDAELIGLLREWLTWWSEDSSSPPKMPNALHIRTAVTLSLIDGGEEPPNKPAPGWAHSGRGILH